MIHSAMGKVHRIIYQDRYIQELEVQIKGKKEKAINYPPLTGRVEEADIVLLNTTAVDLGLGTGGVHFVMSGPKMEEREDLLEAGHIMKLRYTPLQMAAGSCEEQGSAYHAILKEKRSIEGMPVLVGELHSMLPILVAYIKLRMGDVRMAYIMTDKACLPISLSRNVRKLKELGWLEGTITTGQAFGGDLEAVNIYTALLAARHVLHADIAIVVMGPGIVGTGTPLGFTGMEQVENLHAATTLQGIPILVPRVSSGDHRERHHGISHHTLSVLEHTLVPVHLPLVKGVADLPPDFYRRHWVFYEAMNQDVVKRALSYFPGKITSMGRDFEEDPVFFMSVARAADYAVAHHLT